MNNYTKLKWDELKLSYQPSDFSFAATEKLLGSNGIIGQESAQDALELGLKINARGYNIYICGECGVGKLSSIKNLLKKQALHANTPSDIIYVYHFRNPEVPQLIMLSAGDGKQFKQDMDEFIQFLLNDLPLCLESPEINKKRQKIIDELDKEKEKLLMTLSEQAEAFGILVKTTKDGIGFAPLGADGDIITKEEYNNLSKVQKSILDNHLSELYDLADEMTERINAKEKNCIQDLDDLDKEIALDETAYLIKYLKEKYHMYPKVEAYLDDVCEDILEHLNLFIRDDEQNNKELKQIFPWAGVNELQKLVKRYQVNLLVDHSKTNGAPVILDDNLENTNLAGRVLLDSELNTLHSDFTNIRPGLFHKANGGYLVLRVQSLFENTGAWLTLKKMLKTGFIPIENAEDMNLTTVSAIRPEPLEANIKVILVGSYAFYRPLYEHDEDFKKLFKIRINFEEQIDNSKEHIGQLANIIKALCDEEQLGTITMEAILKIAEYGNRIAQNPKKLPANISTLLDLVREASAFAEGTINEDCITKAIRQRHDYKLKIERRIDERIADRSYLIDSEGEKVGQVNGLAIYAIDEYMFGRPVKITATTYKGKLGIIDIEKESGLGGEIHTKGVQIITGFLGYHFAQDMPLSLSCNICFEQSYSGIDGDSASSAELYAILSSLSQIPIKQSIAATGSVNQYGQIQPIGGVNEKIEGFFKICKERGLKGNEGVIIPVQNKKELILDDEVIEAVKMNKFHIYAVTTVEEGMEIITGYSYSDIKQRVFEKLKKFNKANNSNI